MAEIKLKIASVVIGSGEGGGGGVAPYYTDLPDKPSINGETLAGNMTSEDLGLASESQAVPSGGTTGQVLAKKSNADNDVQWVNQEGSGTDDYADLTNKPQINSVALSGNKSASDLGLATANQGSKADTAVQPSEMASAIGAVNPFAGEVNATDAQRNQALANVSNQEAGYDDSTPPIFTGKMGYVVLQPEKQGDATTSFAAQIANKPNTIFEIRDVYDCGGTVETPVSVALPDNCTLKFNGGMLKNCTLSANTPIVVENPSDKQIFSNVDASQRITMLSVKTSWFGSTTSEIRKGLDMLKNSSIEINGNITFDGTTLVLWSVNTYTCKGAEITAPAFETAKEIVHLFVDWLSIDLSNLSISLANGFKGVGVAVYSTYEGEFDTYDDYWQTARNKYGWNDIYLPKVLGEYVSNGDYLYYNEEDGEYTNQSIGVAIKPGKRKPYYNGDEKFNSMFFNHFHVNCMRVTTACITDTYDVVDGVPTVYTGYYTIGKITVTSWWCVEVFEQMSALGNFDINIYHQCNSHTKKFIKTSDPYGNMEVDNVANYYIEAYDISTVADDTTRSTLIDNTPKANYNWSFKSKAMSPISKYFKTKYDYSYNNGGQQSWKYQPMIFNSFETCFGAIQLSPYKTPELKIGYLVGLYNSYNFQRNAIFVGVTGAASSQRVQERAIFIGDSELISYNEWNGTRNLSSTRMEFLIEREGVSAYEKCLVYCVKTEVTAFNGIKVTRIYNVTYDASYNPIVTLKNETRENLVINTIDDYYKLKDGETAYLVSHSRNVVFVNHNLYYEDGGPVLPSSATVDNVVQAPLIADGTIEYDGLEYDIKVGTSQKIRVTLSSTDVPSENFDVKITLGDESVRTISIDVSLFTTTAEILEYIKEYFNTHYDSKWYASHYTSGVYAGTRIEFIDRGHSLRLTSMTGYTFEWGSTTIAMTAATQGVLSTYTIRNHIKYPESGTLAARPTITESGLILRYFATDEHKWITWDGNNWYYDDGTQVS